MAGLGWRGWVFIGLLAAVLPACALLISGDEPVTCVVAGHRYPEAAVLAAADGCNACTCTASGFSCTTKPCSLPVSTCTWNGEISRRGDVFRVDACNTCTCGIGGVVSCTNLVCPGPHCLVGGRSYDPGVTFAEGDTTCVCGSDGTPHCTTSSEGDAGCTSGGTHYALGATFPGADGETCSCVAPGGIRCGGQSPGSCLHDGKSLAPGDGFDAGDGCNRCMCEASGTLLCTARSCEVVEGFIEPAPEPVNVLFVVSDTQNADVLQQGLADHLVDMQRSLTTAQSPYTIAVTSTATQAEPQCPKGTLVENGRVARVGVPRDQRLLLAGRPNLDSIFRQDVSLGTCHLDEWGLEATLKALTPPLIDHDDAPAPQYPEPDDGNLGLLPPQGKMAVVLVSSGDDSSPGQVADYLKLLQAVPVEPRRPDRIEVHALLGLPGGDCSGVGDRYAQLAALLGGTVRYVCGGWGTSMADLGVDLARHQSRFLLAHTPYDRSGDGLITEGAGEIAVSENGERMPSRGPDGTLWSYDAPTNAVIFPSDNLPPQGASIEVRFLAKPAAFP